MQAAGSVATTVPPQLPAEAAAAVQKSGIGLGPLVKSPGFPKKSQGWPKLLSSVTWQLPAKSLDVSRAPQGSPLWMATRELMAHPCKSCPGDFLPGRL